MYYRKVNTLKAGVSFGADALLMGCKRNATIKVVPEEEVHFAILNQKNFNASLAKIENKKINAKIDFLQNIPCF
jgi:hypothetical protein